MDQEIVSVVQVKSGLWMLTVDGTILGDARPQQTKEAAIAYAKKIAGSWPNVLFEF